MTKLPLMQLQPHRYDRLAVPLESPYVLLELRRPSSPIGHIENEIRDGRYVYVTLQHHVLVSKRVVHSVPRFRVLNFLITTQAKRNLSSRSGIGGVRSAT